METTQRIDNLLDTVIHADCMDAMADMPDNYVDTVITDPPAGIGFMGKSWDKDRGGRDKWIDWLAEIMTECLRVTKPGGVLLCWSIPRTSHWTGMAIENAGWRIVDKIAHLFGSGFPKSLDVSKALDELHFTKWLAANPEQDKKYRAQLAQARKSGCDAVQHVIRKYKRMAGAYREVVGVDKSKYRRDNEDNNTYSAHCGQTGNITTPATDLAKLWDGWGTALKPSREDWFVAYKPLDGTYAQNAEKWGVAGLWIDGGRIETAEKIKVHHYDGQHSFDKGRGFMEETETGKGRFPSNTILSCTCEDEHEPDCPVRMLDEQSGESGGGKFKSNAEITRTVKDTFFVGKKSEFNKSSPANYGDKGCASRFFYCAKSSRAERNAGCEGMEAKTTDDGRQKSIDNAYQRGETVRHNAHPTVKPLALMEYLCKLTKTPTGGIVLDPFAGSGTTGCAAYRVDRPFILIEKELDSVVIARARIQHEKDLMGLFPEQA